METNTEFAKWFITLGVGGILAGFMFMFYRKDIKQFTELWKIHTEILIVLIKEDIASNTKLITMLETWERNNMRRSDVESLIGRIAEKDKTQ
jgi:hypothetical protein